MLEAGSDYDFDNVDWEMVAAKAEAKMLALGVSMSISKLTPQVTPLADIYREPKAIDQDEVKQYNAWLDLAKAKGLVSYGYSDSGRLLVVLADNETAMPWKDARSLFGNFD